MRGASLSSGKTFWGGSSGRWAGEQLIRALGMGQELTPDALRLCMPENPGPGYDFRSNGVLRRDEWIEFDEQLIDAAQLRLRGVQDLVAAGLTRNVPNAMGKTLLQWEKITDLDPATVSLDGMARTENDRPDISEAYLPLPITHKDFTINLRTLAASRNRGEALDTTMIRMCGREIAEKSEEMLFVGGKTFGGHTIYGYTTHPDRNTMSFNATNWSNVATTGDQMLADLLEAMSLGRADRMYGPWMVYVSSDSTENLEKDFKTNVTGTIRQRLLAVEGIQGIRMSDWLPANSIVMVMMVPDVVQWVTGVPLQTVQWDIQGGFAVEFKAFQIEVPLIRSDADGRSGIIHIS